MAQDELAFTLFNEINIIAQLSTNEFERVLPHGLTTSQFSVLNWFVRVDDVATPGRLATAFMVTRGAMTNTLKKLASKGFVSIAPDEASGRSKRVTMTAAGRRARDDAIAASRPMLAQITKQFSASEIERLLPLLQTIRAFLDEHRYQNN